MNHRHSLSRFAVAVMLGVIFVSVSFSAAGIAAPVTDSPTDVGGQALGQAHPPPTTSKQNASNATASVELDSSNNTTIQTVVVSKVRLPNGGFVAVHDGAYAEAGLLRQSLVTVSKYLSPGVHKNVSIPVKRGVPGIAGNSTRLDFTRTNLSVIAYRDTNNNTHYDYALSYGSKDKPYESKNGGTVADTEAVVIESNVKRVHQRLQTEPVRIQFKNQQVSHVNGHAVLTIQNATLPKGGFVVIHDERYLGDTRDPLDSAIGLSTYLKPGIHRNVTVRLLNESVNQTQTLVAVAYMDTDGDQHYDFVKTQGEDDYAYVERQNGSTVIVNNTATVRVPQSQSTAMTTTTPSTTSTLTATSTPTAHASSEQVTPQAESGRGGEILSGSLRLLIGAVSVFVLVVIVVVKLRGGGR